MAGIAFQNVGGIKPSKTRFDWHKTHKFDCDFGQIIPVFVRMTLPGDYWEISVEELIRSLPTVVPVMHEVSIDFHAWYTRYFTLDDYNSIPGGGNPKGDPILLGDNQPPLGRFNWHLYLTGGFDGNDAQTVPKWYPSSMTPARPGNENIAAPYMYSLWDYMGFPTLPDNQVWASSVAPHDFWRRAYNYTYNMIYRDETLQDPVPWNNEFILNRSWRGDYFTKCLPFQQRGTAPAFPVSGTTQAVFSSVFAGGGTGGIGINYDATTNNPQRINALVTAVGEYNARVQRELNNNVVNLGNALTFDWNAVREIAQTQKWLERNARAGVRYDESIFNRWGQKVGDESLWKPQYIGGMKTPFLFSEVVQTSATVTGQSPQGNLAGHGISIAGDKLGGFHCPDFGCIMVLMTIMPQPSYQQGFPREVLYDSNLEFPNPEFFNLSEQLVKQGELYIANNTTDSNGFGYIPIFDELRTMNNQVSGAFRNSLADWHLGRIFANAPLLNEQFIKIDPKPLKRVFVDQVSPSFLCDIEFNIKAVRPIPEIAEPGLIDHH